MPDNKTVTLADAIIKQLDDPMYKMWTIQDAVRDAVRRTSAPTPAAQSAGQEAVAWGVYWGVVRKKLAWPPYSTKGEAERAAEQIKSDTEVRPLYAAPVNGGERKKPTPLFMTGWQLLEALDLVAPDRDTDRDQLDCEIALQMGDETCHSGAGLYAWEASEPEEGSSFLAGERAADAQQVGGDVATRFERIKRLALDAGGDGALPVPQSLRKIVRECIDGAALTSPAKDGEPVCWWDSERNDMRWKPGLLNCDFADGQPFYMHPVTAKVDGDERDHIALAKSMLALVDEYHERPSSDTRKALRVALTDEFRKLLIRDAPSADGAVSGSPGRG
ncbi:hypothetical protein [Pandoraea pnomenusa]|uniref:hypothetical protein n=1 Tax=Pandoraea pnomenusa TaxID=93220 RepID=UPI00114690A6|nr:hypothetical protein [Pandoraea pnomenusa]QDH59453.1 hypothetical protein FKQ53_09275 [Pandoraea pnomenusa]